MIKSYLKKAFLFKDLLSAKEYLIIGISFMILKYLGEALIYFCFGQEFLTPWQFLNPMLTERWERPADLKFEYALTYFLFTLPFIWVGVSASLRRLIDSGKNPLLICFFFMPFLNYVFMLVLCLLPSISERKWAEKQRQESKGDFKAAVIGGLFASLSCIGVIGVMVYFFRSYSTALFIGIPLVYGFSLSSFLNFKKKVSFKFMSATLALSLILSAGLLILFAMEGAICILMAAPPFIILSLGGAIVADMLFSKWSPESGSPVALYSFFLLPIISQPLISTLEKPSAQKVHVVMTSVVIDQPPAQVWPHVVEFSELDPPTEWMFKLGVAHPLRARIEGSGVGAIRYCQFSTGDFVEPITEWNQPHQLSFDVKYQPHPMKELSIYESVHAPHLDHFMESKRGQFRLISLGENKTLLEGRTWYTINIHPVSYWQLYGEYFIHEIHKRVLKQVKKESEANYSL